MNDTHLPPSQGYYYYAPGDMSIQVPFSNCTIINSTSGCHIYVSDGDAIEGAAQPDTQVHHANTSTYRSRRRDERREPRRSRTSPIPSDASRTGSGSIINRNSFNNTYIGHRIVNNITGDSDGESHTSYEYGEAPTPSHPRRHRSRRQRSRDVDGDPPVPKYRRRPREGETILDVGEDVVDSGGNVPCQGVEAQTDGPPSYNALDYEEPVRSSSKDEGHS